jgi:hypothetical protein
MIKTNVNIAPKLAGAVVVVGLMTQSGVANALTAIRNNVRDDGTSQSAMLAQILSQPADTCHAQYTQGNGTPYTQAVTCSPGPKPTSPPSE